MKADLVRFGVAINGDLLEEIDALATERDCTRSELFRDLARAEIGRAKVPLGVDSVAALTLVYDHHVRDLSNRLTELQHDLGEAVRASLHVHLSHDLCMEVVIIRGKSDRLKEIANRVLGMRGVKHGGVELVADMLGREHLHALSEAETEPASASGHEPVDRRATREKTESFGRPPARPRRGRSHKV